MTGRAAGFTLPELALTIAILGTVLAIAGPLLGSVNEVRRASITLEQRASGEQLASAMEAFAASHAPGTLPAPFTGAGLINSPVDPAGGDADSTRLLGLIQAAGLSAASATTDGTAAARPRVYQRVADIDTPWPFRESTGPGVTLRYETGVLYISGCQQGSACYPNPATGIPGESDALVAGNLMTWDIEGADRALVRFSTLDLQVSRMRETRSRIETLQRSLKAHFQSQFLSLPPDPDTNHFPVGSPAQPLSPAVQGCHDGWYDLSTSNILGQLGLPVDEFATTPWGGRIEYCSDYDVTGTSAPDSPPHVAALRIHRELSRGLAPAAAVNNVVFTQ